MQVPYRKPGKFSSLIPDRLITLAKLNELKAELDTLKTKRPLAAAEVSRLAELGDFSENAEYQLAKARLQGINNAILRIENQINNAEIIKVSGSDSSGTVQIGSTVTVEINGRSKIFQILGSSESDPGNGIISYQSPLGKALIGYSVGDIINLSLENNIEVKYKILEIK